MSASMYNSPYTYRQPPKRIQYPPFFSGVNISFKHVLDSKFLALSVLVLLMAIVVTMLCTINPFWFELVLSPGDATFGSMQPIMKLSINSGLFYLRESEMDNLLFLNRFNGRDVVPKWLAAAQVTSVTGTCLLFVCFVAGFILVVRKFASPTALIILAFFTSITSLFLVAAFVFTLIAVLMSSCDPYGGNVCRYKDNLVWRMIPMYEQMYRVEPHLTPYMKPNWAFFVFIIACILAAAGSVLLWLEALITYRNVSKIRYHQLRQARNPHEMDDEPQVKKYIYNQPVMQGAHAYGMQPVMQSHGPYMQPTVPSQHTYMSQSYSHPPAVSYAPEPKRQRSPPPVRRGPPSETSSTSGPYISREIDL